MASDAITSAIERGKEFHKAGKLVEAAGEYRAALAKEPANVDAGHYLGILLAQTGKFEEATKLLGEVVRLRPDWADARNNYGVALREQGRTQEAIVEFQAATATKPDMFGAYNNLADAMLLAGDATGAVTAAGTAQRLNPSSVDPLLTLAAAHLLRHDPDAALEAVYHARTIDPANDRAVALFRTALSRIVQPWHFGMMNDTPRNDAYEAAIRRAVTPETLVLDIGTGAGLLSMMSARAGARQVVTCEMTELVAAKARQIISRNNFADRVTVHAKKSTFLTIGAELPEKADVLVSEIFDSDLLSEGVLPSLEDAHARLIKPGAKIIPQSASVMVALAGGAQLAAQVHVERSAGFDVSAFNEFMPERFMFDGRSVPVDYFSEPVAALSFDFRQPRYPRLEQVVQAKVTRSGLCLGVVQWLRAELDDQASFENRPGAGSKAPSGWMHSLFTFAPPVQLQAGQTVRFIAGHAREMPYFRLLDVA